MTHCRVARQEKTMTSFSNARHTAISFAAAFVTAMIFVLKTQGGWRETDRLELSGSAGGPVRMEVADTTERDGDEVFKHLQGLMDSVEPQSAAAKKLDGFLQYLIQSNASHEAAG